MSKSKLCGRARWIWITGSLVALTGIASAALILMTLEDFHVPGTQVGDVNPFALYHSDDCRGCHGDFDAEREPARNWRGSLMANAGRDPLFFAQLTTANQDVANVGYFCLRCHVPMSIVSGHANQADGSTLDLLDRDGVNCHFCHSMVDPVFQQGASPHEDFLVLQGLADVPQFFGNAMFVLDPQGRQRGPLTNPGAPHDALHSPFHTKSELCGTCHDVGNVATTRLRNGTWRYNAINQRADSPDPWTQFPLERTYTEWKLSSFANGGVDMQGRFGGEGGGVMETCQDCHMPAQTARVCFYGPERTGMKRHDFAGAAEPVLALISKQNENDPAFDQDAIAGGRRAAVSMLRRAASVGIRQSNGALRVRVVNETGHKLPTGHIEGRRVWLGVRFYDVYGALLREYGHYDAATAVLDEPSTRIYEMEVGLSTDAAALTGYPAGRTTHMSLADTIVKDNRIPPRGFAIAPFEQGGAPVVEHHYADGQYWDDAWYTIPPGAARAEVDVNYQCLPRHYVEVLRDGNTTDTRGQELYDLWNGTGKGAPIPMTSGAIALTPFLQGDIDGNCLVGRGDLGMLLASWDKHWNEPGFEPRADLDGDHHIGPRDWWVLQSAWGTRCP